jgi:hypothetical protein
MIVTRYIKYKKPKRSVAVPVIAHSGELIINVPLTSKLDRWLNGGNDRLLPQIKVGLKRLINSTQVRI